MKKILLLVEGQSEEIVVRDLLGPHFAERGLHLQAVLATTKREKSGKTFKGGITSFARVETDIRNLLRDSSAAAVTTFIDYYGLPSDFPGWGDRPAGDPYRRVMHVEAALAKKIGAKRFVPHLTLHELEAWVFAEPSVTSWIFSDKVAEQLEAIRDKCKGPELIDEGPATAPSKRIVRLFSTYAKTVHGPQAIEEIGLARIRKTCRHADAWLRQLEALASP